MRRLNQLPNFSRIFDWISRIFDWLASNWNMPHSIDLDVAFYMIGLFSNFHEWLRQPLVEITKKSDLFTRTINP